MRQGYVNKVGTHIVFVLAWMVLLAMHARAQIKTEGAGATSQPHSEASALISNIFVDTDLRQALQDIATQAKVTIVPEQSVGGMISAELKNVSLSTALDIVLAGTGFAVKKFPDYYLVYSPDSKSPAFRQVSQGKVVALDYVQSETVTRLLSPVYKEYVQSDPKANKVFITATEPMLSKIVADIRLMDQPPGHVMLEARVVVMEENQMLNLGLKWDWPQIRAGMYTNSDIYGVGLPGPDWPWGVRIGYTPGKEFTNSLLLTLNLLAENGDASIVSNPQIMAQDGRESQIKVTTDEYFQILTTGLYATNAQLEKIESGTIMSITPRLSAGNQVTLDILVEVSDVVSRGENNLPVVSRRSAKSTVRIQNGGTAAIGGLMDTRIQNSQTSTPGLGQIPLLGRLFSSDNNRASLKQMAVFITATTVEERPPETAAPARTRRAIAPVKAEEFKKALKEALERIGNQS